MVRISQSTLDMLQVGTVKKKNKYKAKKKVIDGQTFHSTREAKRYEELKLQQHCGVISGLKTQVKYVLLDTFKYNGKTIRGASYFADFEYVKEGIVYTEDSKGFKTQVYGLKKKMLLSRYPDINFIET